MNKKMTLKMERFCVEYWKSQGDGPTAYRLSYDASRMNPNSIYRRVNELLHDSRIAARLLELKEKIANRVVMEVADVLSNWVQIATADPNELTQYRRTCCRHCYGIDHNYQWTRMQYAMAQAKSFTERKVIPEPTGGFDFNALLDPLPHCPVCFGQGVESVYVADTRKLKGSAKLLYAGLKKTQHGVQVLMRDQDDALRNIAKFLGMFKERVEISGKDGKPIPSITAITTDPIQAAKIYQSIMGDN